MGKNLKRGLVYGNPHSVIGLFRSCLEHATSDKVRVGGVFDAIQDAFAFPGSKKLLELITAVNDFRNSYVAHPEKELADKAQVETTLKHWVETLSLLRI